MQSMLSITDCADIPRGKDYMSEQPNSGPSWLGSSTFFAIQPALAFILSEATSFGQLRAYAKRG